MAMSKITNDDVLRLAKLANIYIAPDKVAHLAKDLEEIITYVEMLKDVDVEGLEPTEQVTGLKNVMRSDKVVNYGASTEELLKNAPGRQGSHIKVKRVL